MITTFRKMPTRRIMALTVAAAALAACSRGQAASPSTTEAPATTEARTTTTRATTTTASTTTTIATTTTAAPPPTFPLTGLLAKDPFLQNRPALVVKIDNHRDALPQAGLNQADIVIEEQVEGITRFFAIFQSKDAAPVGPIRSARTTDVNLLNQLNRPLFVWSGGNANVVRAIGRANAESRAHGQAPGFYRDAARHRRAALEHTLMNTGTGTVYATVQPGEGRPFPFFSYRPAGRPSSGSPANNVDTVMNSVPVHWTWDAGLHQFIRSEYGRVHVDATGAPISAENVVIQFVPYVASPADRRSPEAVSVGAGDAMVLSDGKLTLARWSRPNAAKPAVFTDAAGKPILLTPGRTWIELARQGVTQVHFS
jgi:Protein of unknown function (DUF3048) N-terminal domain/Protein of unknown function (DUF3048) C-terminal domain